MEINQMRDYDIPEKKYLTDNIVESIITYYDILKNNYEIVKFQLSPEQYCQEFKTIAIKYGRQVGHTTAAVKVLQKQKHSVLIVHNNRMKDYIVHQLIPTIIGYRKTTIDSIADRIDIIESGKQWNFGKVMIPTIMMFDCYSFMSGSYQYNKNRDMFISKYNPDLIVYLQ